MKIVLLLGATSDIGQALAEKFATEGCALCLAGRNVKHLTDIANDLRIRHQVEAKPFYFEANDYQSHAEFYDNLPGVPDITVCLFGYLGEQKVAEQDWLECEKIIDTNYKAALSILNIVATSYEKTGKGIIVGISSVAGDRGRQSNYFYGSAKAGFTTYLAGLRNRLYKSGVHVLTVKPGFVDTKMTEHLDLPKALTAAPKQVAQAIVKAIKKQKNTLYVLGIWRMIMFIIKSIPEFIFKKLKL